MSLISQNTLPNADRGTIGWSILHSHPHFPTPTSGTVGLSQASTLSTVARGMLYRNCAISSACSCDEQISMEFELQL